MERAIIGQKAKPISVLDLTLRVKALLEGSFARVWLVGEISNFKRASSGHFYFSLKDDKAQIRAAMWRSATASVSFQPRDGMEVLVSGSLNVYPPRGEYNLVVSSMEEMGVGRLRRAFEQLKAKLHGEGLFQQIYKKPLPYFPRKIGVVTSPTGAAIRDILRVLRHRLSGLHVLIYPARVQGDGAAEEIAAGIRYLDDHGGCDVLIIGRGGGSEEDLWCFNEEVVARAVFAAKTPIVSAVGHEVDISISDLAADIRAATPSNAAELVVKTRDEYLQRVEMSRKIMDRLMHRKLLILKNRISVSENHPIFIRVRSKLNDYQRRLAENDHAMRRALVDKLSNRRLRLTRADRNLTVDRLQSRLRLLKQRLVHAENRIPERVTALLERNRNRWSGLTARLGDLSPLKILARGYSVVFDAKQRVVKDKDQVDFGEILTIRTGRGDIHARVVDAPKQEVQDELFT